MVEKPNLWGASDAYEAYMGRWSRKVAPLFLEWLDAPSELRWLDVGCGTGVLSMAISGRAGPSGLAGIDPSESFVEEARSRVPETDFQTGSATDLPFAAAEFDCVVSGLVLNFVPDKPAALTEMVRVARPGATVAAYVWDYAGHMQFMRYFFDTAKTLDPASSDFDDGIKAPICRPGPLAETFSSAGLTEVCTSALDITTPFTDFDDYWSPFLGGTGSAPKYCMSIDEGLRNTIRDAVREKLPTGPEGEILLAARAWAVRGRVPG